MASNSRLAETQGSQFVKTRGESDALAEVLEGKTGGQLPEAPENQGGGALALPEGEMLIYICYPEELATIR
jgi:hypothetical protein